MHETHAMQARMAAAALFIRGAYHAAACAENRLYVNESTATDRAGSFTTHCPLTSRVSAS